MPPLSQSLKTKTGRVTPNTHSSKRNQWYFGMKAHIDVDAESALAHIVRGTSGHVRDIAEANTVASTARRAWPLAMRVTRESKSARTHK